MRTIGLALLLMAFASPVMAQGLPGGLGLPLGGADKTLTPEERELQEQRDKAYKESLKKIPNQAAPNDPWGSARAAEQSSKPTAPKAKPAASSAQNQKKSGTAN